VQRLAQPAADWALKQVIGQVAQRLGGMNVGQATLHVVQNLVNGFCHHGAISPL